MPGDPSTRGSRRRRLLLLALGAVAALAAAILVGLGQEPRGPGAAVDAVQAAEGQRAAAAESGLIPIDQPSTSSADESRVAAQAVELNLATLELLVLDRAGPVEGAKVSLGGRLSAGPLTDSTDSEASEELVTDADGRLTIPVRPRQSDTIRIFRSGSPWARQIRWKSPGAGATKKLQVRLIMADGATELSVLSLPSGQPLPGAQVSIGSRSAFHVHTGDFEGLTDERGLCTVPISPQGSRDPLAIHVTAPGHSPASYLQGDDEPAARILSLFRYARLSGRLAYTVLKAGRSVPEKAAEESERGIRRNIQLKAIATQASDRGVSQGAQQRAIAKLNRDLKTSPSGIYLMPAAAVTSGSGSTRGSVDGVTFDPKLAIAKTSAATGQEWELPKLALDSENGQHGPCTLVAALMGHARIVAENIYVGPGDDIVIEDAVYASKNPLLSLRLTYEGGRPFVGSHTLQIKRLDPAEPALEITVNPDDRGRTGTMPLPPGRWSWQLNGAGVPLRPAGELDHRRTETQVIVIKGVTSVAGRIDAAQPANYRFVEWQYWAPDEGGESSADGSSAGGMWLTQRAVPADREGRFVLPIVPAGATVRLMVSRGIEVIGHGGETLDFDDPHAITVHLPPGTAPWSGAVLRLPKTKPSSFTSR